MFNYNTKKINNYVESLNDSSAPIESIDNSIVNLHKFESNSPQTKFKTDKFLIRAQSQATEIDNAIMEDSSEISYGWLIIWFINLYKT